MVSLLPRLHQLMPFLVQGIYTCSLEIFVSSPLVYTVQPVALKKASLARVITPSTYNVIIVCKTDEFRALYRKTTLHMKFYHQKKKKKTLDVKKLCAIFPELINVKQVVYPILYDA